MDKLAVVLSVLALLGVGAFALTSTPNVNVSIPGLLGGSEETQTKSFLDGIVLGPVGGGATPNAFLREIDCTSVPKILPTTGAGVTSTIFGITFTGVNTSTKQVYWVDSIASSTADWDGFDWYASATTTDSLQLQFEPKETGIVSAAVTINACYLEFTTSTAAAQF